MSHLDVLRAGIFWEGGVDYGSAHVVSKKGVYSGGMGRFCGVAYLRGGVGLYSGRVG